MEIHDIKSSRELADVLENVVTLLRTVPEFQITEPLQEVKTLRPKILLKRRHINESQM